MSATLPMIITMGDSDGVGAEITLLSYQALKQDKQMAFCLYDNPSRIQHIIDRLKWDMRIKTIDEPQQAGDIFTHYLPILPLTDSGDKDMNICQSIIGAVNAVQQQQCRAMITNPIAKESLANAGYDYPGHTEMLAALAQKNNALNIKPVMMLYCDECATVPATIHCALRDACAHINTDELVILGRIIHHALQQQFHTENPRIAFSGLNPHAGENGKFGDEEQRIIIPAMQQLRDEGINITGVFAADTLFIAPNRQTFDVAICMTHDQALIPVKTLAFDEAVNVTLNLPFIRTSPDHGTAFDLAGTGRASPKSMMAAIRLAHRLSA